MAPRRSARSSSSNSLAKTASITKTASVETVIAEEKPKTTAALRKRAASPDRATEAPAGKRQRAAASKSENEPPEASEKTKTAAAPRKSSDSTAKKLSKKASITEKEPPAPHVQKKPYFNALPVPPAKQRPGLLPFAWGAGNFGQFGMGPDILGELSKPKRNAWAEEQVEKDVFGEEKGGMESVAAGGLHTVFIDERGAVWTCGVNDDAALGRVTQNVPDPEKPGSFIDVDDLTAVPHRLQTLVDENFRAVKAVSGDSICAVVSDQGELRVWGSFRVNEGSLGFASGLKYQFTPVSILTLPHKPGDWEKVSSVASGGNHIVVLTTHGNIYTWGAGEQCQLGRKVIERRKIHGTVPEKVILGTRSRKAVVVGAGAFHSFAVDDNHTVWGWGLNSMGQTGTGHAGSEDDMVQTPTKVKGLSPEELNGDYVVQIEGGTHHTLFLTHAGKVYSVGRSTYGQLGLPEDHDALKAAVNTDIVAEPVLIHFPDESDPIVQIAAGINNSAAVTAGGALYSWGQGVQGELGLGDEDEVRTPQVVVRKQGGGWFAAAVSCGGQHTIGLFRKKSTS